MRIVFFFLLVRFESLVDPLLHVPPVERSAVDSERVSRRHREPASLPEPEVRERGGHGVLRRVPDAASPPFPRPYGVPLLGWKAETEMKPAVRPDGNQLNELGCAPALMRLDPPSEMLVRSTDRLEFLSIHFIS
ncbi:hypothetical protein EBZ80_12510 [bacterium]|nr:hypothetical protein [bacterium]